MSQPGCATTGIVVVTITDRAELLAWIANTRRFQRWIAIAVVGLAALSLSLGRWHKPVAVIGLLIASAVAIIGFWVTSSHLADWRFQLEQRRRR